MHNLDRVAQGVDVLVQVTCVKYCTSILVLAQYMLVLVHYMLAQLVQSCSCCGTPPLDVLANAPADP